MRDESVEILARRLDEMMAEKLKVRGKGLKARLRRAGRTVPARVRRDIQAVIDAQALAENPKLARQLDMDALHSATARASAWLHSFDVSKRRKDLMISVLGGVALSAVVVFALLVLVLAWRDFV